MKMLALVVARGGSKRIPGKNVRPFLGRPLIEWTLDFARLPGLFDTVLVSTDSADIARCCQSAGVAVPWLREDALATDHATSVDVALDALERQERTGESYDFLALLQPTSPVRRRERWQAARAALCAPGVDAAIGVSPARDHPFHVFTRGPGDLLKAWQHDRTGYGRSQDLPPAWVVNGGLYLIRTAVLRRDRTFFPLATVGITCDDPLERIDLDTEADWFAAETLVQASRSDRS